MPDTHDPDDATTRGPARQVLLEEALAQAGRRYRRRVQFAAAALLLALIAFGAISFAAGGSANTAQQAGAQTPSSIHNLMNLIFVIGVTTGILLFVWSGYQPRKSSRQLLLRFAGTLLISAQPVASSTISVLTGANVNATLGSLINFNVPPAQVSALLDPKATSDIAVAIRELKNNSPPQQARNEVIELRLSLADPRTPQFDGVLVACTGEEPPITIGPFISGETNLESTGSTVEDAMRALATTRNDRKLVGVLLIGSADRTPLKPELIGLYGSNAGLARARAQWVKEQLEPKLPPNSSASMVILDTDPAHVGVHVAPADLALDRAVRVCALWGRQAGVQKAEANP